MQGYHTDSQGESDFWTPMGSIGPQKSGSVDRRPDVLHREAGQMGGHLLRMISRDSLNTSRIGLHGLRDLQDLQD
jgi:hypothetical protein